MPILSDTLGGYDFTIVDDQTFTASSTWMKPSGLLPFDMVVAHIVGGGGGGQYQTGSPNEYYGGSGGTGVVFQRLASNMSASESVVVGAGGTLGAEAGSQGGDSSFAGVVASGGAGAISTQYAANDVRHFNPLFAGGSGNARVRAALDAVWGGGAGANSDLGTSGGNSIFAGNGGDYTGDSSSAIHGNIPGGGGACGNSTLANTGNGGRGEVRVLVVRGTYPSVEALFS